jgi:hypothetical protein
MNAGRGPQIFPAVNRNAAKYLYQKRISHESPAISFIPYQDKIVGAGQPGGHAPYGD